MSLLLPGHKIHPSGLFLLVLGALFSPAQPDPWEGPWESGVSQPTGGALWESETRVPLSPASTGASLKNHLPLTTPQGLFPQAAFCAQNCIGKLSRPCPRRSFSGQWQSSRCVLISVGHLSLTALAFAHTRCAWISWQMGPPWGVFLT